MGKPLAITLLLCFAILVNALPIEVDPRPSASNNDIATSWTIVGSVAGLLALLAYLLGKFVLPRIKAHRAAQERTYMPRTSCQPKLMVWLQ